MVAGAGRVAAVLDWEMSTLGDPLTDVGLLRVYWTAGGRSRLDPAGGSPLVPVADMISDVRRAQRPGSAARCPGTWRSATSSSR